MTTFRNLTTSIESNDIRATIAFYRDYLGFRLRGTYPDDEPFWAMLEHDGGIRLMVAERNAHSRHEQTVFTGSLYFDCENVAELWERLRHTAEVCYPLETFDYGMLEFAVFDNNGYVLRFGEPVGENS